MFGFFRGTRIFLIFFLFLEISCNTIAQSIIPFALLISSIGLYKFKRWGWYLAVGECAYSLTLYEIGANFWFPFLEILTLPYLVLRREHFGLIKRINKKWLKIAFIVLFIASLIWGTYFYWTRKEYDNYLEQCLRQMQEQLGMDLWGPVTYWQWNGGIYVWRTLFLLICAWMVWTALWRTQSKRINETKIPLPPDQ